MKSITKLMIVMAVSLTVISTNALAQCDGYTYYPADQSIGWEVSNYNQLINMDAATLTDSKYPKTGAEDGKSDNLNYGENSLKAPVGSGNITVPLYNYESGNYVPSGYTYDIKYVNCVFAPDHYGSAYTKWEDYGEEPSGKNDACTKNDNTCLVGDVYGKQGFIELSRQAAGEGEAPNSKCGYIELNGLKGVDKVQWSYSTTSWKRGVICEVKWDVDGEWEYNRVIPSDVNNYATFAEQGYQFEEIIGNELDPDAEISIRFRVFDCDTITFADEFELDPSERSPAYYYKQTSSLQPVRIHQIKVFSCLSGTEMGLQQETGISSITEGEFGIYKVGKELRVTQDSNVEIYTIDGKLIKQLYGDKVSIAEFAKGVYVVKATADDGSMKNLKIAL